MVALVFLSDMQKKNLIKEVEGGYWMRLQKSQESEIIKHGLTFIFFILNSQITLKNIQNVQLHSLVFVSMHFDEYFRGKNRQAHARTKGF